MPHRFWRGRFPAPTMRSFGLVTGLALLFAATLPQPAQAQVDLIGTYSLVNNVYYYAFRVINNTPDEIAIISARLPDTTFVVNNPAAPEGFMLNYSEADGDNNGIVDGYIDFLTDPGSSANFGPFTGRTFTFDTPTLLSGLQFEGNFADSNFTSFQGSASLSVAPEPTSLLFVAPGLLTAGYLIRRKRA